MLCPPQVPFEAASKAFADAGTPEWVIKGSMQLYELMNAGCSGLSVDDFVAITGKQPSTGFDQTIGPICSMAVIASCLPGRTFVAFIQKCHKPRRYAKY